MSLPEHSPVSPTIGVDLGTTFSCMASYKYSLDKPEVIVNEMGNRTTPSTILFTDSEPLVGDAAKALEIIEPANTVYGIKRIIGRQFDEKTVQQDIAKWPFKVVSDSKNNPLVEITNKKGEVNTYTPEFISSLILRKLRDNASKNLGVDVTKAVITIPAYFSDSQREATKDAGKIAGLDVLRVINEPTAAAIAYGFNQEFTANKNVLVFDLGGGTFDVSILEFTKGKFTSKACDGNSHLGGEDFDYKLMEHLAKKFEAKNKINPLENKRSLKLLKVAAERCKCNLTHMKRDNVHIDNLINGIDLDEKVTRVEFEEMCNDAFNLCFVCVKKALELAKMQPKDITDIILVGGSSVIPKIKEMVTAHFYGKKPVAGVPAEEAVALGAAIFANQLVKPKAKKARKPEEKPKKKEEGPRPKIKEEAPPKVVIEDDDEEEDDDDHGIRIIETASYSIGVRKQGGEMQRFIERGTTLPAKRTFKFQPVKDNVDHAYIKVYEGESPLVKNNRLLATCKLCDLPKKPACEVTFDITISVASDGTTKVSAELAGTKQEWNIESSKGRLSEEEIAEQIAIAEKFKEIDEAKVQYIRVVNEFQSVCNTLKRNATKNKDSKLKLFASEQILWIEDLSEVPDGDPAYILAQANAIRERLAEIQKKL